MSFDFHTQDAYMRGEFMLFQEANVGIASSPMLYGLAVYTVFTACWDEVSHTMQLFRLADHYKRLSESAKIMDFAPIESIISYDDFVKVAKELVTRNKLQEDALIRATLFIDEEIAGTKTYGLKTSFCAYVYPMGEILPRSGVHLCVSSWQRTPDNAIPSRAKINGSYVNATLMKNEALRNGYDDAIALDEHGHVAESTVANVFMVRRGKLITPHSATDILEGITRNTLLAIADKLAIPCEERDVDRSELYTVDEMFLCGSSARLTPILSVDKRSIGTGTVGPITKQLATTYESVARGKDDSTRGWLTIV